LMKYVSLLLHIYQPPTQDTGLVERIDRECYLPLSGLLKRTGAAVGLNINYSLTEHLQRIGSGTLDNLAMAEGVEFTDSGAYHPIFPLINQKDVVRQLRLNREGNKMAIGENYSPVGVFPPEMAYSPKLPPLFGRLGYRWTVTDDVPWIAAGREVPYDSIPRAGDVSVLLRSNFWSNRISFHGEDGNVMAKEIRRGLRDWTGEDDAYLLIAMDGETYGHHRRGMIESFLAPFLETLISDPDVSLVTPGELPAIFPPLDEEVPPGSWSTTQQDSRAGIPWPLWDHPDNRIHSGLWSLLREVSRLAAASGSERVAKHADKMLYSCPFWWASAGHFDPVQVRRGIIAIMETAQAIYAETCDRGMFDGLMTSAFTLPVVTGEESGNAQEEG
jgi:hypothetical protein